MATRPFEPGYDYNFVEEPPDALKCLICLMVVKDPQQHGECGKLFCKGCISEHKKRSTGCPYCREKLCTFNDGKSAQEVKSLKVICKNVDNGCQWTGELRAIRKHLSNCKLDLVPCPKECENDNVIVQVLRKDLKHHLAIECSKRQFTCPHCKESGEHNERTTTHLDNCPQIEVQCPNLLCSIKTLRCDLSNHRSTCNYERVLCKYAEFGCEERLPRREMEIHENDDQLHVANMQTSIVCLKDQVSQQRKTIKLLLCTKPATEVFKFTKFSEYKTKEKVFYSPPFYSNEGGYKFCISVHPNGLAEGDGTHISVYAHLMRGNHDDSLIWPFRGMAKIELLNQLEDKNHHKNGTVFTESDIIDKNMTVGERVTDTSCGTGWGIHKYIPHSKLEFLSYQNCQYLTDDTLVFRVSVKLPYHKPWLINTI